MKVIKISCGNGDVHHLPLDASEEDAVPFFPRFPDATAVELTTMTREEYLALPAAPDRFL
jgi:hypothetical protein